MRTSVGNIFQKPITFCRASLGGTDECVRPYAFFACLILVGALIACSKPPQPETAETPQATGLESIPDPDPSKYPNFSDMTGWKNPYLVVREDGIGLVDLSNHEVHL
ncbi:MAG TPA: hypothetical protein VGD54_05305, partial [Steroidobacteraceae bacterium]